MDFPGLFNDSCAYMERLLFFFRLFIERLLFFSVFMSFIGFMRIFVEFEGIVGVLCGRGEILKGLLFFNESLSDSCGFCGGFGGFLGFSESGGLLR